MLVQLAVADGTAAYSVTVHAGVVVGVGCLTMMPFAAFSCAKDKELIAKLKKNDHVSEN